MCGLYFNEFHLPFGIEAVAWIPESTMANHFLRVFRRANSPIRLTGLQQGDSPSECWRKPVARNHCKILQTLSDQGLLPQGEGLDIRKVCQTEIQTLAAVLRHNPMGVALHKWVGMVLKVAEAKCKLAGDEQNLVTQSIEMVKRKTCGNTVHGIFIILRCCVATNRKTQVLCCLTILSSIWWKLGLLTKFPLGLLLRGCRTVSIKLGLWIDISTVHGETETKTWLLGWISVIDVEKWVQHLKHSSSTEFYVYVINSTNSKLCFYNYIECTVSDPQSPLKGNMLLTSNQPPRLGDLCDPSSWQLVPQPLVAQAKHGWLRKFSVEC